MSRWFRMHDELLDDPKVQKLDPALFKTWVNLLCLASRNNGSLPDIADIAFALRLDEDVTRSRLNDLFDKGLLDTDEKDGYIPHNWGSRQFRSDNDDSAARRQREKRERDRIKRVTDVSRVTSQESHAARTDTDTEVELSYAREGVSLEGLETSLRQAAGWEREPAPMLSVTGPVLEAIKAGADLEQDVLPVVRAIAPKARSRTSWKFFIPAIIAARDDRIASGVPFSAQSTRINSHAATHHKPTIADNFAAIDAAIASRERELAEAQRRAG